MNNCNFRSSSSSFFFRILILTSCSSFKCCSYTFSMFTSLFPCSLTVSELQFGSFVCSSLKRLSSCSFSEVFLPLSNSATLSGPTRMYDEVDGRLSFSLTSLEASSVCSPAYIHTYFIGSSPRGFSESILHYKIINQVHDNKNITMIKEDKGQ